MEVILFVLWHIGKLLLTVVGYCLLGWLVADIWEWMKKEIVKGVVDKLKEER